MARAHNFGGGEKRRGTNNGASKLNEDKVRAIRRDYRRQGRLPDGSWQHGNAGELGRKYGINRRNVLAIVDGLQWGWLE